MRFFLICLRFLVGLLPAHAIDTFDAYDFVMGPAEERRTITNIQTPHGPADVEFTCRHCELSFEGGVLTASTDLSSASFAIVYTFDEPIDLGAWDSLRVDQTTTGTFNPVDFLFFDPVDHPRISFRHSRSDSLSLEQNQVPLYRFSEPGSGFIPRFKPGRKLGVTFQLPRQGSVTVDYFGLYRADPRPASLNAQIKLVRDPQSLIETVMISSDRAIQENEEIRLEASFDLVNWFVKREFSLGEDAPVSTSIALSDGPYFRYRIVPKLEPVLD